MLEIFTGNRQSSPRSPGPSYQLRSDVLYKNKKLFLICPAPLPPGQEHFKQFPTPGLEGLDLDLSPGLPGGEGVVTGKIEPCISFQKATAICHFFSISVPTCMNKSTALWKVLLTICHS